MRKCFAWLMALVLGCSAACARAEVYVNAEAPADWAERALLRLTVIDVDRSDAMLLECGGEAMMVDGGSGEFKERVFDAVDAAGVTRFQYLFNTHADSDHIHGLMYLMSSKRYQVDMFASPNEESYQGALGLHSYAVRLTKMLDIPYHQVEDGEQLTLGGAQLQVMRNLEPWGPNARSAVLMVTFGECRVLLTGDIDARTMEHYVEKYGAEALKADILKAPHHGIATIGDAFREAVAPEVIFVTNMRENSTSFHVYMTRIAPEIRLMYAGDGTIVMETDGADWYIRQEAPENDAA